MKQNPKTVRMWMISCLLFSLGLATFENDRDFKMCGIWRHGNASQNLKYDLKTGCEKIEISANESTLSIRGSITAKSTRSSSIHLDSNALQNQSHFCVIWEPLLDLLIVEVNGKNHILCESKGLQGSCCTDLSLGNQTNANLYGIMKGSTHGDIIRSDVMEMYEFEGGSINCKEKFCDEASQKPRGANILTTLNNVFHGTQEKQVEHKATRHLEAPTFITAVGCAVSLVSCLVLLYWLCKRRGKKDQSLLVHGGLVVATFFLCLCFSLTSTLANTGNETVCKIAGTLLHYSLLSTLCWMTVEVFHTFLLVCCVFASSLPPCIFYLAGFGIPAVLVCRLLSIGEIYGFRNIMTSEDATSLYFICWMLDSDRSRLAHFIINIGLLAVVLSSGAVMLFLATRMRNRPEWRKNRMAFLSIWGLTCLFGTTWGLFNFVLLTEATLFLFCIINSSQGCFLMLRYYTLEWMKKRCELSLDGGSAGSVMLQCRDGVF